MTESQDHRSVQLHVNSPNPLAGTLALNFQDEPSLLDLDSPSSEQCKNALEVNPKFGEVLCDLNYVDLNRVVYNITFLSWPVYPVENNVYFHNGNPSASHFLCDTTSTSPSISCVVNDLSSANVKGLSQAILLLILYFFC